MTPRVDDVARDVQTPPLISDWLGFIEQGRCESFSSGLRRGLSAPRGRIAS